MPERYEGGFGRRRKLGGNGVDYDPRTGWATIDGVPLTEAQTGAGSRRDPRLFGRAGDLNAAFDWAQPGAQEWIEQQLRSNPDYWNVAHDAPRESDGYRVRRLELKPEVQDRLRGRVQVPQLGQGGYSEVKDPSKVEWDDEFGLVTTPDNIADPDDGPAWLQPRNLAMLAAAGIAGFAGPELFGGLSGLGGGAGAGAGAAGAGSLPTIADAGLLSAEGIAAASPGLATAPALAGAGGGGGFLSTLGSALSGGGASAGDVLSAAGSSIADNPLGALRTAGGLASLGAGMSGGGGGGGGGAGSMNDLLEAQAQANRYNWNTPTGSRNWDRDEAGNWTVNDRMSPAEQANFEQVQGMNSDWTGLARSMMGELPTQRRDLYSTRPSSDSYFGRWRG